MATPHLFAVGVWISGAAALAMVARLRRRRRFVLMATDPPPETQALLSRHRWLPLRHAMRKVDPALIEAAFDDIRAAFAPQQVDYTNTAYPKNHWKLSCFMEYTNGVAAKQIDLAAGAPMLSVCGRILEECDAAFSEWYSEAHPCPKRATRSLHRAQSFVTRYRPNPDETHLPRHIDGANVDGSLVLGLPTYDAFGESGGLTVWDGEGEAEVFRYPVASGDACLLDSRVWHQSNPIDSGERCGPPASPAAAHAVHHAPSRAASRLPSQVGPGDLLQREGRATARRGQGGGRHARQGGARPPRQADG